MHKLTHFRLCPHSRSIRLVVAELGMECELAEERPWDWRPEFLALNPSGDLPVLQMDDGPVLAGAYAISEYLHETQSSGSEGRAGVVLFPGDADERAEVRRLVDWFHKKLDAEVTRELHKERLHPRMRPELTSQVPDADLMRAIRANLRYHMSYLNHLADQREWLAGREMSFADLAAAAHVSSIDYLDEVPWDAFPIAKSWYARVKSRPSFRALLADRVPGMPPPQHYANLDF
ncbi:MAG: glutathione S-transferase family protein [Bacteroidota bacterium]